MNKLGLIATLATTVFLLSPDAASPASATASAPVANTHEQTDQQSSNIGVAKKTTVNNSEVNELSLQEFKETLNTLKDLITDELEKKNSQEHDALPRPLTTLKHELDDIAPNYSK